MRDGFIGIAGELIAPVNRTGILCSACHQHAKGIATKWSLSGKSLYATTLPEELTITLILPRPVLSAVEGWSLGEATPVRRPDGTFVEENKTGSRYCFPA